MMSCLREGCDFQTRMNQTERLRELQFTRPKSTQTVLVSRNPISAKLANDLLPFHIFFIGMKRVVNWPSEDTRRTDPTSFVYNPYQNQDLKRQRARLPIAKYRDNLENHQVVAVVGETGSGSISLGPDMPRPWSVRSVTRLSVSWSQGRSP